MQEGLHLVSCYGFCDYFHHGNVEEKVSSELFSPFGKAMASAKVSSCVFFPHASQGNPSSTTLVHTSLSYFAAILDYRC